MSAAPTLAQLQAQAMARAVHRVRAAAPLVATVEELARHTSCPVWAVRAALALLEAEGWGVAVVGEHGQESAVAVSPPPPRGSTRRRGTGGPRGV